MRDLCVGILEHQQVASKKGKNVERAGFSVGIVEHCVRECRGMESIGLLHLTLSSLSVKWHHRQLQGPLYNISVWEHFLNKSSILLKLNFRSAQTPEGNHAYLYILNMIHITWMYRWSAWGWGSYCGRGWASIWVKVMSDNHDDQCCGWPIIFIR